MNLCKYKDIFGKPNTGVHSYRIFNIAVVDVGLTLFAAYMISAYKKVSFLYISLLLFIAGIFFHRLFCVKTTVDKLLFGN